MGTGMVHESPHCSTQLPCIDNRMFQLQIQSSKLKKNCKEHHLGRTGEDTGSILKGQQWPAQANCGPEECRPNGIIASDFSKEMRNQDFFSNISQLVNIKTQIIFPKHCNFETKHVCELDTPTAGSLQPLDG